MNGTNNVKGFIVYRYMGISAIYFYDKYSLLVKLADLKNRYRILSHIYNSEQLFCCTSSADSDSHLKHMDVVS